MLSALAAFGALLLAQTPAPKVFSIDPTGSALTYHIVHKLHQVAGASSRLEGKVAFLPDGQVRLMVRAPIASFLSGDANRDAHMQETLEVDKYGYVVFKAATRVSLPAAMPATQALSLPGELEFHGRKKTETVPVKVEFTAPGALHVSGSFDVSLEKYEVERPALLFVKVEDKCRIDLDLMLREVHP